MRVEVARNGPHSYALPVMRDPRCAVVVVGTLLLLAPRAFGQQDSPGAPDLQRAPSLPDSGGETEELTAEAQIEALRAEIRRNEEARRKETSPLFLNGYVDFGFFVPLGNDGVGWIRDSGPMRQFPQYSNFGWVFLGDILGTPINTRGEPADLGDAPGLTVPRYDGINSNGAATFILNEINLRPRYQLSDNAIMRASINFVPRPDRISTSAIPSTPTWPSSSTC